VVKRRGAASAGDAGRRPHDAGISEDTLFGGRIKFFQPAPGHGYRANVDAILLAAFSARANRVSRFAVDLGAGAGAVGLSLFYRGTAERVAFVERDPTLAALCVRNLEANRLAARGSVHPGDIERTLASVAPKLLHAADLVVANPPYVAPHRDARARAETRTLARRLARHGELLPFLRAAADALGRRGRACLCYPAHALLEVTTQARQMGLEPKRVRFVHGRPDRPARIALVELSRAKAGGLVVEPPLVETGADGRRTPELASLLLPNG
jgi:tRNA1Val (adenine37-N6)-methyltransferase